jgi:hypothetical protein
MKANRFFTMAPLVVLMLAGCTKQADTVRFAHLTDPHLYDEASKNVPYPQEDEGCLNFAMFRSVIAKMNSEHALKPFEFALVSGDIGVEKLIERALNKKCKDVEMKLNGKGELLFDGVNKETEIRKQLQLGAQEFANTIRRSEVKTWVFVNGNNDLCNEDTLSINYFNFYILEVERLLKGSGFLIHNLVGNSDYVGTFSARPDSKHIFVGFENGSWKNNQSAVYAETKNYSFQVKVLNALKKEVAKQEKLGKLIHLVFHIPHFDDPFNAPTAKGPCSRRIPTNVAFKDNCTVIAPLISTNAPRNFYSAWLVKDDFRSEWDELLGRAAIKSAFAGHFHIAKRGYYEDLDIWQSQLYPSVTKYDVTSPIAIKNQILSDVIDQSRGFSAVDIDRNGAKTVLGFFADQRQYYECPNDVLITPWETTD